ncbi:hypothetical protein GCM10022381_03930 [Leifsonia kafniensis]|uniref:Uncharacterized protein n=1 Tax=Leifsonia kafniensis TaxID=475957 RepID=A0ABP7K1T7_9MICO
MIGGSERVTQGDACLGLANGQPLQRLRRIGDKRGIATECHREHQHRTVIGIEQPTHRSVQRATCCSDQNIVEAPAKKRQICAVVTLVPTDQN